jgi:hypothetical protein
MTNQPLPENDRLLDLLATYATDSLTGPEVAELRDLLRDVDGVGEDEFEIAAAALHLAMNDKNQALPDEVVEKVLSDANDFFSQQNPPVASVPETAAPSFNMREALAWFIAAAAVVFAFVSQKPDVVQEAPKVQLTATELRDELLKLDDTVRLDWTATKDPAADGASGDIVWNTKQQKGFMSFKNLAQNMADENCYQLWIFVKNQKHPIDGGIFDITKTDQLIPIDAKLEVSELVQFAITVEPPGGVVVSDQERIPLLAAL